MVNIGKLSQELLVMNIILGARDSCLEMIVLYRTMAREALFTQRSFLKKREEAVALQKLLNYNLSFTVGPTS